MMLVEDEPQKVVVIQDASKDVSPSAIRWLIDHSPFKPGDVLILFGVLHQVNNPSTLSFMGAGKLMGYKVKVDSSSIIGVNPKYIQDEVNRKKEEYSTNVEIQKIAEHCEAEQLEFHIHVRAGATPKVVALKAAKSLKATWVVLDRHMKGDKKYFMDKLQCKISRIKRDNTVEMLRGPKARVTTILLPAKTSQAKSQVRYDEMIPGSPKKEDSSPSRARNSSGKEVQVDDSEHVQNQSYRMPTPFYRSSENDQVITASSSTPNLGNHEASGSSLTKHSQDEFINKEPEPAGEQFPFSNAEGHQGSQKEDNVEIPNEQLKEHKNYDDWMGGGPTDEMFNNSICSICKNRRPRIGWKRDFTYAELHAATEGFSPRNFLSEGGFGSVYRGELGGLKVAVKQHKSASFQGEKEFKSEVNVLSKARNEKLVMLLGSCSEGSHRLLVYEYVCNGSLDQHLSKHSRRPLSWENRMKIALGAAKGLLYLHKSNIIHRDMRPNNILITHDHEALLGDFGLARTKQEDSDHSWETRVVGTLGYLAPEYAESGKVSTKTDVYAFGVVLLQLITGLKTADKMLEGKSLVGWARPLLKERNYPDLIDPRMSDCQDVHQLFWMVRVAEKCLSKDPHKRITMDQVVNALNILMGNDISCGIKNETSCGVKNETSCGVKNDSSCGLIAYSPAQSNSASSSTESNDSPRNDDSSFTIETTSVSSSIRQMDVKILQSPGVGFPSSPPVLASSHFYRKIPDA